MITLNDSTQYMYVKLTITVGNQTLTITDDVMQGENNIVDESTSSSFPIGNFIGKYCTFTIDNSNQQYNQYDLYGKQLTVTLVGIDNSESDRGVYIISEATKSNDIIEITAMDSASKTEKQYVPTVDFPSTIANVLADIAEQCNITVGVTPDITDPIVQMVPENTSCHDMIGYLAAIECANARFDFSDTLQFLKWDFELEGDYHDLRDFQQSPDISADSINITGIIVSSDSQIQSGVYGEDGYTLKIDIPIIADGTGDLNKEVADYIGERVCGYNFRIMSGDLASDASVEFGDMAYTYDRRGAQYLTPITGVTFALQSNTAVKTVAETPVRRKGNYKSDYEKAKEYVDTRTAEVSSLSYYLYSNQSLLNVGEDHEMSVGFIRFGVVRSANVDIWHEFKMNCALTDPDEPMVIRVIYYLNGVALSYEPVHTILKSGLYMLDLQYLLEKVSPATGITWDVHFLLEGGTMTLAVNNVHICLKGQGLVSPEAFDGFLEIFEEIPRIDVHDVDVSSISELVALTLPSNTSSAVSDNYTPITIGEEPVIDYILDQNGENILDQNNEPIIGYENIMSPTVSTPDIEESVIIQLILDESLVMRCGDGFYAGDDMSTGGFNTLFDGGTE